MALESEHFKLREALLREFIVNHFQYVSIVPSLRGVPLYRTDISFIFSHEILMLHIRRNISRISSIVLKRIFDLVVSLSILIVLSPIMLFVFLKSERMVALHFTDMNALEKMAKLSNV